LVTTIKTKSYKVVRILETRAHADDLTVSAYVQQVMASIQGSTSPICIDKRITQVQKTFGENYSVPANWNSLSTASWMTTKSSRSENSVSHPQVARAVHERRGAE
jgi:hypothetical protein